MMKKMITARGRAGKVNLYPAMELVGFVANINTGRKVTLSIPETIPRDMATAISKLAAMKYDAKVELVGAMYDWQLYMMGAL